MEEREIIPRILRDMNDGVLVLDMRGTILYINEQGRRLLGALGILYHMQGNIWGLSIIHYVLGEVATFLRYLI